MRYPASSHIGQSRKRPNVAACDVEVLIQALRPFWLAEENQPGKRDVGRCQRPLQFAQLRLGNPEIDRFVVQILEDAVESSEKNGSVAITLPPGFNLPAAQLRNAIGLFQMVQHVGERNHVKALVFYGVQFIDLVAIKHKIEIVKMQDVTGDNIRVKLFQG